MIVAKETIVKCLPVMAAIWFFVVIDSYLVWTSLAPVMHFIPAILVVWGTVQISNKLSLSCNRRVLFICILIYYFWIVISFCNEVGQFVKRSTDYVPMLCIVLWPNDLLLRIYKIIRKVVVFFAIGSSILSVLIFLGLNDLLPHIVLPAREALHVRIGAVYHLYGLFIADCFVSSGVSSRACGMLQEPGHFAILLGFIYLIDRFRAKTINYWIVICGLFTFSSAFVLIVFFTEIHRLFSLKNLKKIVVAIPFILLLSIVLFKCLPTDIQEQIEFFAYGRNLENVIDAFKETSSLTGALDERASDYSIANYEKMSSLQYFFGGGHMDISYSLSDYRGMILHIGLLGMFLSIFLLWAILMNVPIKLKISVGLAYFLIIIHRSWMLYDPYIYFLSLMAVVTHLNRQYSK